MGFGAALRTAATIVAEDPIFGLIAYGGRIHRAGARIEVQPMDGVRRRFHWVRGATRFHLTLERDGFAAGQPLAATETLSDISFVLENRAPNQTEPHATGMQVSGLPAGSYEIALDGKPFQRISGGPATQRFSLPMQGATLRISITAARPGE